MIKTVAIIGSFKQHYNEVCKAWGLLTDLGLDVTSPKGTPIIKEGIPFVRFTSDEDSWSDALVQTVALHRILRADFVYVVAPNGYVGRTTCYEIGRIIQVSKPLYFSEPLNDLPIHIPDSHIMGIEELAEVIRKGEFVLQPLYISSDDDVLTFERHLLLNEYLEDDEFHK